MTMEREGLIGKNFSVFISYSQGIGVNSDVQQVAVVLNSIYVPC